ncbi:MAG: hypothetical protein JXB00_02340 [Bacteroidales bacterium]|nr:hypothetical protein [Bacteroidales bacterium]
MNKISFCKRTISFSFTVIILLITASCNKNEIIDPFWDININWDKSTVTSMLDTETKSGKHLNCVFSFEKEFYIKNKDMDARVKASLSYPVFKQDRLKRLQYSLIAEFKNETIPCFNPNFFEFFKTRMISGYGHPAEEILQEETIKLEWDLKNYITVETTVFKEINHYYISVAQKN